LILTVLGDLAEFERELIRHGVGRARAVANGVKMGRRPKLTALGQPNFHSVRVLFHVKQPGRQAFWILSKRPRLARKAILSPAAIPCYTGPTR
jgi:hypothetical protein